MSSLILLVLLAVLAWRPFYYTYLAISQRDWAPMAQVKQYWLDLWKLVGPG